MDHLNNKQDIQGNGQSDQVLIGNENGISASTGNDIKESPVLQAIYRIRYCLARPLQVKILPSCIPVIPLPYLKHVPYITLGQILLLVPWILIFMASYDKSFNNPDTVGTGLLNEYAVIAAFLTANKANSIFNFLFGISYEVMVPIHNLYACLSLITISFHLHVAYVYGYVDGGEEEGDRLRRLEDSLPELGDDHYNADNGEGEEEEEGSDYGLYGSNPNFWKFLWDGNTNMTGSIAAACVVGLMLLSFSRLVRQYLYEPWLYSHVLFSLGVILFGFLHQATLLILPFVWWMIDYALRFLLHTYSRFPLTATITKCGEDLVELRFPRTFAFDAGQFVRIAIPSVGLLEFSSHPITLSSAPFQKEATLHIRASGGWSSALVELAETQSRISILVEGPYGHLSMNLDDYPMIVCIAGGIGITPCESIARQIINQSEHGDRHLDQLRFVWIVRDTQLSEVFPSVVTNGSMMCEPKAEAELEIQNLEGSVDYEVTSSENKEAPRSRAAAAYYSNSIQSHLSNNNNKKVTTLQKYVPEVYLTGKDNSLIEEQVASAPHLFRKGRPDISAILKETIATAQRKGVSRVAVITCGPVTMVENVKATCRSMNVGLACRRCTKSGADGRAAVALDVHHEIFNY
ncbi:hypothetical protein ACA910_005447 [Epithemia clementina (nom. ined.)]